MEMVIIGPEAEVEPVILVAPLEVLVESVVAVAAVISPVVAVLVAQVE